MRKGKEIGSFLDFKLMCTIPFILNTRSYNSNQCILGQAGRRLDKFNTRWHTEAAVRFTVFLIVECVLPG